MSQKNIQSLTYMWIISDNSFYQKQLTPLMWDLIPYRPNKAAGNIFVLVIIKINAARNWKN